MVVGTDYEIPVRGWWQAGLAKKFLLSFFLRARRGAFTNNLPCVSGGGGPGPSAHGGLGGHLVGFWLAFGGLLVGFCLAFDVLLLGLVGF